MLYRTVCLLSEFVHSICPPPISPPPTWLPACLVRISESTGALACWLQTLGLLSLGACNRPGLFCETNPTQQGKLSPGPCLAPFGGGVEDLRHTPRALLCAPFERERRAEKVMVGSFLGWLAWALNWWTYDTGMRPPNSSNMFGIVSCEKRIRQRQDMGNELFILVAWWHFYSQVTSMYGFPRQWDKDRGGIMLVLRE